MHDPVAVARRAFAFLALSLSLGAPARAQATYGTVALDPSLADASAKVTGVLNKHPVSNADLGFCEGPSVDAAGNIFFTEQAASVNFRILKVTSAGQASEFAAGFKSNGTEIDPQGRLTVAQTSSIATYSAAGARTVLATVEGDVAVNDLTIGSTGAMYFSNWGQNVFHRSASGTVAKFSGYQTSNGIEWIEERNKLLLSQDGPDQVWIYDVAANGTLSNGKTFVSVPEPDGITVDEKGNIYVASYQEGKVHVFDSTAKSLGTITVTSAGAGQGTTTGQPGNVSNMVIGANKVLYITGDGGLYAVPLKVGPRLRPGTTGLREGNLRAAPGSLRLSRGSFDPAYESLAIALPAAGGRFSVRILDARRREVWAASGTAGLEWRGRNAAGDALAPGRYLILAQSADSRRVHAAPVGLLRR
jgi:gluconolactonase